MVSKSPWSVKGVEPEAREAAKIAARRAGLTVGEWLSHTIRTAATDQLSGNRGGGDPQGYGQGPDGDPDAGRYDGYPDSGNGRGHATGYGAGPSSDHISNVPAPTIQALFDSIQKLSNRVEQAEMKTTSAVAPLMEQVENLSEQVEEVRSQNTVSTAPVERAVSRLSERLEQIEENRMENRSSSRGWWPFKS